MIKDTLEHFGVGPWLIYGGSLMGAVVAIISGLAFLNLLPATTEQVAQLGVKSFMHQQQTIDDRIAELEWKIENWKIQNPGRPVPNSFSRLRRSFQTQRSYIDNELGNYRRSLR